MRNTKHAQDVAVGRNYLVFLAWVAFGLDELGDVVITICIVLLDLAKAGRACR